MAVVTKYGQGYPDPSTFTQPKAQFRGNAPGCIIGTAPIANGDNANSVIYMGKVPSSAIILSRSLLTHTAITGVTDLDIGLGPDLDCLADGLNVSSAGTKSINAAVTTANLMQPAWQLAGFTSDPGRELDLYATLKADASAAGTLAWEVYYAKAY